MFKRKTIYGKKKLFLGDWSNVNSGSVTKKKIQKITCIFVLNFCPWDMLSFADIDVPCCQQIHETYIELAGLVHI